MPKIRNRLAAAKVAASEQRADRYRQMGRASLGPATPEGLVPRISLIRQLANDPRQPASIRKLARQELDNPRRPLSVGGAGTTYRVGGVRKQCFRTCDRDLEGDMINGWSDTVDPSVRVPKGRGKSKSSRKKKIRANSNG